MDERAEGAMSEERRSAASAVEPQARTVSGKSGGSGLSESARAERRRKVLAVVEKLVLAFGVFLVITGGVASLSWGWFEQWAEHSKFLSPTPAHHYAVAAHNMLTGLLFLIASIGLYLGSLWGRRLTLFTCFLYAFDTIVLTTWEYDIRVKWVGFEAFADAVFWLVVPIVIMVLLLVSAERQQGPAPSRG